MGFIMMFCEHKFWMLHQEKAGVEQTDSSFPVFTFLFFPFFYLADGLFICARAHADIFAYSERCRHTLNDKFSRCPRKFIFTPLPSVPKNLLPTTVLYAVKRSCTEFNFKNQFVCFSKPLDLVLYFCATVYRVPECFVCKLSAQLSNS